MGDGRVERGGFDGDVSVAWKDWVNDDGKEEGSVEVFGVSAN